MPPDLFRKHALGLSLAALAVLLLAGALALPLRVLVEGGIKAALIARGFKHPQLTIISMDSSNVIIENVSVESKSAYLALKNIGIEYSLPGILTGRFRTIKAAAINLKTAGFDIAADDAIAERKPGTNNGTRDYEWKINDVRISGTDTPFPVMQGRGSITAAVDNIEIKGRFESADSTHKAVFQAHIWPNAPEKSALELSEASMPWNGGTVSTENAVLPLGAKRPYNLDIKIRSVSAGALMQQLTGKRASATGTISGALPVTVETDGSIVFREGNLQADGPGTIAMQPDVVPGDNAQVVLLRDALRNFHYTRLSIGVNSGKDKSLAIQMTLEGSNPDMQGGRPFKVNVNLRGDVLDFIRQNMLLLLDPRKIWEQDGHAKK